MNNQLAFIPVYCRLRVLDCSRIEASLRSWSPPAQGRRDVGQDGFDHVYIVLNAKLVRHGQQQSVSFGDGLIRAQLLDELAGFRGVGSAENEAHVVHETDLVGAAVPAEIGAITVVHEREYRS